MVRVAEEGRGTNKNASPAGIEKSLGGVTGRRYTQRDSRGCVPVARAQVADRGSTRSAVSIILRYRTRTYETVRSFYSFASERDPPGCCLYKMAAVNRAYSNGGNRAVGIGFGNLISRVRILAIRCL